MSFWTRGKLLLVISLLRYDFKGNFALLMEALKFTLFGQLSVWALSMLIACGQL